MPPATGLTEDTLLDGRVALAQPAAGYRVAIDPVLLAAAVPARPGERVLDAGTGTGAAALCLAVRVPSCAIVGVELDPELCRIAGHNVARNGLEERIGVRPLDLADAPERLGEAGFDHVMTNPPYLQPGAVTPPSRPGRAAAHVEGARGLAGWLDDCLRLLRPRGRLTVIHRADRLDALLGLLSGPAGDLVVFPLWPTERAPAARRVIVRARKGARGPMRLARGLVLHYLDGRYTEAAEAVLRRGEGLAL